MEKLDVEKQRKKNTWETSPGMPDGLTQTFVKKKKGWGIDLKDILKVLKNIEWNRIFKIKHW